MVEQLLIFLISLVANVFSALSGGGAGLIQLPALIFLGLPFGLALATHKVATIALGIGATARHLKENRIETDFALIMILAGVPGVVLGWDRHIRLKTGIRKDISLAHWFYLLSVFSMVH